MLDCLSKDYSIRRTCVVLGLRRQTYYSRKSGHRPEEKDEEIADLLHQMTKRFVSWGFWKIYHYMRNKGYTYNHKKLFYSKFLCQKKRDVEQYGAIHNTKKCRDV